VPRVRSAAAGKAKPAGSFSVALARARDAWDGLTGGPGVAVVDYSQCDCGAGSAVWAPPAAPPEHAPGCAGWINTGRYSDTAAAAILDTALGLWSDTAASMGEDPAPED
jgi:hypothetical protein